MSLKTGFDVKIFWGTFGVHLGYNDFFAFSRVLFACFRGGVGTKKGQNLAFYPKFLVEATGLEPNPITCVGA